MAKTTSSVISLNPKEMETFILDAIRVKDVAYIAGPGAIGKSGVVHGALKKANLKMIDIRLSQMLSEDLTGLPERDGNKATYLPFDVFPLEGDTVPAGYDGWGIFLDELSSASDEVRAAIYSLILDRTVGGKKLHPYCAIVAAGNRQSDSAIARELQDTLITRLLPVNMEVHNASWLKWAATSKHKNDAVIEFIKKNPNMLYAGAAKKDRDENETFATPRGWEKVMKHANLHEKRTAKEVDMVDAAGIPTGKKEIDIPPLSRNIFYLMAGAVGPIASKAFKDFYEEQSAIPNPWEVAASPHSIAIPANTAQQVKLCKNLAEYFVEAKEQSRQNVLTFLNRIGGDPVAVFIKDVESKLGQSDYDKKLVSDIKNRLNMNKPAPKQQADPLLGN